MQEDIPPSVHPQMNPSWPAGGVAPAIRMVAMDRLKNLQVDTTLLDNRRIAGHMHSHLPSATDGPANLQTDLLALLALQGRLPGLYPQPSQFSSSGALGPRQPSKRWIPPPSWTPGQGISLREFLWLLDVWQRITAMPANERGAAVALSLGGKAGRIARSLLHQQLDDL